MLLSSPQYASNAEAGPSRPATPAGSSAAAFRKGPANSLLQSALGLSRPASSQGISRNVSSASLSKQSYVTPAVVSNAQQFHEHFSHLTSSLLHSQDSAYRAHLEEVKAYGEACRMVGEDLQQSEETVETMIGCLKWVEERGESLRIAGETLMQEEVGPAVNRYLKLPADISLVHLHSLNSTCRRLTSRPDWHTLRSSNKHRECSTTLETSSFSATASSAW